MNKTMWLLGLAILISAFVGCDSAKKEPAFGHREDASTTSGVDPSQIEVRTLQGGMVRPLAMLDGKLDTKAVVLYFVRTDCPVSNRYAPEIDELSREFAGKGIQTYVVYPDSRESDEAIATHLSEYRLTADVLRDDHHDLVSASEVTITPEVAIYRGIDGRPTLVYRGRIDDRVSDFGKARPSPIQRDVHDVLEAVVADQPTEFRSAKAVGCPIPDLPSE
jgi:peroxiredoxin